MGHWRMRRATRNPSSRGMEIGDCTWALRISGSTRRVSREVLTRSGFTGELSPQTKSKVNTRKLPSDEQRGSFQKNVASSGRCIFRAVGGEHFVETGCHRVGILRRAPLVEADSDALVE